MAPPSLLLLHHMYIAPKLPLWDVYRTESYFYGVCARAAFLCMCGPLYPINSNFLSACKINRFFFLLRVRYIPLLCWWIRRVYYINYIVTLARP